MSKKLTKKDFKALAELLSDHLEQIQYQYKIHGYKELPLIYKSFIVRLAHWCDQRNPDFDQDKFFAQVLKED